ncbi:MAG: fibronectin type III domain-containing protein, partial [Candidatus Thermoplasmatota archaeon]|nr:fibronectin type III domain-containing protein [Candidatus Thermoplasmatota archaeon]
ITVTDAADGAALVTVVLPVGGTVTAYASSYNTTAGYLGLVSADWSGLGGVWAPVTGTSSTYTAGFVAGTFTQTAAFGVFSDTFDVEILDATVDYLRIRDAAGDGAPLAYPFQFDSGVGPWILWAAAYNNSVGFIGNLEVAWSTDNPLIATVDTPGSSATLTEIAPGWVNVTVTYGSGIASTVGVVWSVTTPAENPFPPSPSFIAYGTTQPDTVIHAWLNGDTLNRISVLDDGIGNFVLNLAEIYGAAPQPGNMLYLEIWSATGHVTTNMLLTGSPQELVIPALELFTPAPEPTAVTTTDLVPGGFVVTFVTDAPVSAYVEYSETSDFSGPVFQTAPMVAQIHRHEITGLTSSTPYYYRVVSGGVIYYNGGITNTTLIEIVLGWAEINHAPQNLTPSRSGNDVRLDWDDPEWGGNVVAFNVYRSTDRFAAFPSGWTLVGNYVEALFYVDVGVWGDAQDYFYLVRGRNPVYLGTVNSTMGFKAELEFDYFAGMATQENWISLPYNVTWLMSLSGDPTILTASDIVLAIEGGLAEGNNLYISAVKKWNPSLQGTDAVLDEYRYKEAGFGAKGWGQAGYGTDFVIEPGDGISLYLSGNTVNFVWPVIGTDQYANIDFEYFAGMATQENWISVPYTFIDMNNDGILTASDIVLAIEGGLAEGNNLYISAVKKWNPSLQGTDAVLDEYRYKEAGFGAKGWGQAGYGTDFVIEPGDGISLYLSGNTINFIWNPDLQVVPQP